MNKQELKYIIFAVLFALVWFAFLLPKVLNSALSNQPSYIQFLVFNLGIFIFLQVLLKSITLERKIEIAGSIGVICLFISLDIFSPPLMVGFNGELLGQTSILYQSSSDYVFGELAINLGLSGFLVFLFTYVFIPIILLLTASKLIPNFVRRI